jgi:outer membrane protein OmpA-like peptidoglycan-associated protein
MRNLFFIAALSFCCVANAQRAQQTIYMDGTYNSTDCINDFDEVEEVYDGVSNKLVIHKKITNVYHVNGQTEERHYDAYGRQIGYARYAPRCRTNVRRNAVVIPNRCDSYEPIETYEESQYSRLSEENGKKWFFYFQFNSSFLTNKEELYHLIDFAANNMCSSLYIDAYADAGTGDYESNLRISKARANTIINVLLREGISRNRIFVKCHGSINQPYSTNNLNRCVTVSARPNNERNYYR